MFVYNTIWLHVHVPIIMLLMNNTRHLLISFQRTISVFYVADSDECTSLHFCSNRLLREMTIKIMFPTTKKKWVCYLQKKKKQLFFQIYRWSIVTEKWCCYGIIIIDHREIWTLWKLQINGHSFFLFFPNFCDLKVGDGLSQEI